MSRLAVIIPAAGKSSRFGGMEKKPFVSLDGRPVWQRAAEAFWSREDVTNVYVVISPDDRADFLRRFGGLIAFNDKLKLVDGGAERFESVANALALVPPDVPLVAVHDAVRPLVTQTIVSAVVRAAEEHGAAMPAVPVADTLKQVDPNTNRITGTVPRAGVWQAQTPQVFRRDWLAEAYAKRAAVAAITDDAQLIEAIGHAVVVVPGAPTNFKITTKDDLELADAILKARTAKTASPPPTPKWGAFDDEAKW